MVIYDVISNDTKCTLYAGITDGCLGFSGCDTGEVPRRCFGDSQYEYWMNLDKAGTEKLLEVLRQENNAGPDISTEELLKMTFNDLNATAILRKKCKENNIEIQFYCWP